MWNWTVAICSFNIYFRHSGCIQQVQIICPAAQEGKKKKKVPFLASLSQDRKRPPNTLIKQNESKGAGKTRMLIKIWGEKKRKGKQKTLVNKHKKHPPCITAVTKC